MSHNENKNKKAILMSADRILVRRCVNVMFNPNGHCIDGSVASNPSLYKRTELKKGDMESYSLLPSISGTSLACCPNRVVTTTVKSKFSEEHTTAQENVAPLKSKPSFQSNLVSFHHEKHWFQVQSQVENKNETADNFSWNNRSNDFLMAYYNYLNDVCEPDRRQTRKSLVSSDELMRKYSLQEKSPKFIYGDVNKNLATFNYRMTQKYPVSKQTDFQTSLKHQQIRNQKANIWLSSYVGISPIQNIKFSDLLSALDNM